ncbi:hypothetical protein TM7_0208 [candidate division TM7 genomosp. GTL1]|nr:hypothetical protein TM7_0208 [candidate division TM7 genomosp. GTL1]
MDKPVTKRRRKLNAEQLEVLELLYKFRFGSNDLFAQYFGKKDRSFVYKRLSILLEQGLIGKRFDSSYRLLGKPAAYYLTPDGVRSLQGRRDPKKPKINIKAIYKDKTVSEQFVAHSLELFAISNKLKTQYGSDLLFFTKSHMNNEKYDYFPRPLPDAYIRLKSSDKHFFLDVFHDNEPHFVAKRRARQYIKYDEDAEWSVTETDLPVILAVCESPNLAKRTQKYMSKALDDAWSDNEVVFAFTTKAELMSGELSVWQRADAPRERLALADIS